MRNAGSTVDDGLMTIGDFVRAAILADPKHPFSEDTARRLAQRGLLPVIRLANGTRLFKRADVEKFIETRRAAAR